jgi:hypothetical protein
MALVLAKLAFACAGIIACNSGGKLLTSPLEGRLSTSTHAAWLENTIEVNAAETAMAIRE